MGIGYNQNYQKVLVVISDEGVVSLIIGYYCLPGCQDPYSNIIIFTFDCTLILGMYFIG